MPRRRPCCRRPPRVPPSRSPPAESSSATAVNRASGAKIGAAHPEGDRDAVRWARIDVHDTFGPHDVKLGEVRALLHLGDLHPAERSAEAHDQVLAQIVRERTFASDVLHLHDDGVRLRLADPDGKQTVAALLPKDHHVTVGRSCPDPVARQRLRPLRHPATARSNACPIRVDGGGPRPAARARMKFALGPHVPRRQIPLLLRRQSIDAHSHRRQLEPRNLAIHGLPARDARFGTATTACCTRYSAASDWLAKLMSMTDAG